MATQTIGILLALGAAVAWAVSPFAWTSAGRRIGGFNVMLLRNVVASVLLLAVLGIACAVNGVPMMPTAKQWLWVIISGLAGVAIGDAMCFQAYVLLGARHTVQIGVLSPVAAALLGLMIGEVPTWRTAAGMVLVLGGVAWAVSAGGNRDDRPNEHGRLTILGLACAVGAAVCTGAGAVALRVAEKDGKLDPLLKTSIRVASSAVFFWILPLVRGQAPAILGRMREPGVTLRIMAGSFLGVLIGMFCFVAALGFAEAALVTTLVATSPLLVLPIVAWRYRSRIPISVVIAMIVALAGVALIAFRR